MLVRTPFVSQVVVQYGPANPPQTPIYTIQDAIAAKSFLTDNQVCTHVLPIPHDVSKLNPIALLSCPSTFNTCRKSLRAVYPRASQHRIRFTRVRWQHQSDWLAGSGARALTCVICCDVCSGELYTGEQAHFYMETQAANVIPDENDVLNVFCSSQGKLAMCVCVCVCVC